MAKRSGPGAVHGARPVQRVPNLACPGRGIRRQLVRIPKRAALRLSSVHGRPWFAKRSLLNDAKIKIAPVHPDFDCSLSAAVPDGFC
jgi:hypothetical protein